MPVNGSSVAGSTSAEEQPDGRQSLPLDHGRGERKWWLDELSLFSQAMLVWWQWAQLCGQLLSLPSKALLWMSTWILENQLLLCEASTNNSAEERQRLKDWPLGCTDPRCVDCSSHICYKCIEGFRTWIGKSAVFMIWECEKDCGLAGCQEKNCVLREEIRIGWRSACLDISSGATDASRMVPRAFNLCTTMIWFCCSLCNKNCMRYTSDGKECWLCQ